MTHKPPLPPTFPSPETSRLFTTDLDGGDGAATVYPLLGGDLE